MITLTILIGPEAGKTLTLQGERIEIGRGSECDLVLNDRSVSRRHCLIERREDNFVATDLQSTNATFLNDDHSAPIQDQIIQVNDELTLGQIRLRIDHLEPDGGKTDTAPFPPHRHATTPTANQTRPAAKNPQPVQPQEDDHTRISLGSTPARFSATDPARGMQQAIFPLVLTILNGPGIGRIYIPTDDSCSLGRENTCDIALRDPQVSSLHATIQREGERYSLSDKNSANGTFLSPSPQPIDQVDLTDGDVFILGQTQLRVGLSTTIGTQADSVDGNEATFFSGRTGIVGSSPVSPAAVPGQLSSPNQEAMHFAFRPEITFDVEDRTLRAPMAGDLAISLRIIEGPNSDAAFTPQPGTSRFTVGRGRTADFQLHDRGLSRIHFSIEATPSGFSLIDIDSLNGTFLNQATERVEQAVLHDGDEIRVSRIRIQVTISEAEEKTAFVSSPPL